MAAWLLKAMIAWVPAQAPADVALYDSIANDFASVALDAAEQPVFPGELGRARTALLMASIASWESGYHAGVDDGRITGDGGSSYCIMQVRVIGKTAEGWTGRDLTSDRQKCLRVALRHIRESFRWCHRSALEDRLAGYTVGSCRENERLSRTRVSRAERFWSRNPSVRRSLDSDPSLSFMAKNVTIVAVGGRVVLHGSVENEQERAAVEAHARQAPGVENVDNQLQLER